MVLEVPDHIFYRSYTVGEFQMDVAVMLFQKRVLSLARAAEWVGMSRLEFQKELKKRGVYLHYDVQDLHEELDAFKKMGI